VEEGVDEVVLLLARVAIDERKRERDAEGSRSNERARL
jgi:hypothetical protein